MSCAICEALFMLLSLLTLTCAISIHAEADPCTYSNTFVTEIESDNFLTFKQLLCKDYSIQFVRRIHSNFYLFVKEDLADISTSPWKPADFLWFMKTRTASFEQEVYHKIKQSHQQPEVNKIWSVNLLRKASPVRPCMETSDNHWYGMGVQDAWAQGYSGKGVSVAVVDSGIDTDHDDLVERLNVILSYDFVFSKPVSRLNTDSYPDLEELFAHGTNCAGLVGATRNDICITGIAPNVALADLRIIDPRLKTLSNRIAGALAHKNNDIQIYSNSYGTSDSMCGFSPISKATRVALENGVKSGRGGRGNIFVFPSGNGGKTDHCNADEFANLIETITIGSIGIQGRIPVFAEPCSCVLASTFGVGKNWNSSCLMTTSPQNECIDDFSGTSASVAMAAGIFALVLEANPNLSKRDLDHIIVETAKTKHLDESAGWVRNGVNKLFSDYFGFGILDAAAMIKVAKHWVSVPPQQMTVVIANAYVYNHETRTSIYYFEGLHSINSLEYVQVEMSLWQNMLDDVTIVLTSPMGTSGVLLPKRNKRCFMETGKVRWKFTSTQFWGENATGKWTLKVSSLEQQDALLVKTRMFFFGFYNHGNISVSIIPNLQEETLQEYGRSFYKHDDSEEEILVIGTHIWIILVGSIVIFSVAFAIRCRQRRRKKL